MIYAHQPGSKPVHIPERIPNPAVVPQPAPAPRRPAPKEPVKVPEKIPAGIVLPAVGSATLQRQAVTRRPTLSVWSSARARRRDRAEASKKALGTHFAQKTLCVRSVVY